MVKILWACKLLYFSLALIWKNWFLFRIFGPLYECWPLKTVWFCCKNWFYIVKSSHLWNYLTCEKNLLQILVAFLHNCVIKNFTLMYFVKAAKEMGKRIMFIFNQGCGFVFIFSGSGSGSRVWCWRPIRIRIQYGSRALMTKNWKKITAENFFYFFLIKKLQFTYP